MGILSAGCRQSIVGFWRYFDGFEFPIIVVSISAPVSGQIMRLYAIICDCPSVMRLYAIICDYMRLIGPYRKARCALYRYGQALTSTALQLTRHWLDVHIVLDVREI